MYSTCIFCNRPLGENTVLEEFPVGRRLAFDASRGRLWVVCHRCERWNLSPLEERWEAIEAAERLFAGIRTRVSTDQIGLARHREGLELVRIGQPMRPEFAAWRYGDQFGRRRRRALLIGTGAVAVVGSIVTAGIATGVLSATVLSQSGNIVNLIRNGRVLLTVETAQGETLKLKRPDLDSAGFRRGEAEQWSVVLKRKKREYTFTGPEAERVAGLIMPKLNSTGAGRKVVQDAVRAIETAGGPEPFLAGVVNAPPLNTWQARQYRLGALAAPLGKLPTPTRLALEMALHEEQERRALAGELKGLELAWQAAEEVAAIADDLLLPEDVRRRLAQETER